MRKIDRRRVVGMTAGAALTAGPAVAREPDVGAAAAAIDAFLRTEPFYGVVQLGQGTRIDVAQAAGLADIEAGTPAQAATRYGVASITKWLVTAAVLRLADQGRLDLDGPIGAVLPDLPADTGAKVTLRRLLSNTSGVPNGFFKAVRADPAVRTREMSAAEAAKLYGSGPLAFTPGTKFDYSHTNWILVRAIVEAAAGEDFGGALKRLVFDPLGLPDTGFPIVGAEPPVAAPYGEITPAPVRRQTIYPAYVVASGGFYSAAPDLQRAAEGIFGAGFLSESSRRALTTVEFAGEGYALGGRVRDLRIAGEVRRFAWETGDTGGYKSLLAHGLDDRRTLVILNNTNVPLPRLDQAARTILGALYGGTGAVAG